MRNGSMSFPKVDVNPQPITCARAIFQQGLSLHLPIRSGLKQGFIHHGDVPFRQISWSHREFSCREEPSISLFRLHPIRASAIAEISKSIGRSRLIVVDIEDRVHARSEEHTSELQ